MFCKYCGTELKSKVAFCPNCGGNVESQFKEPVQANAEPVVEVEEAVTEAAPAELIVSEAVEAAVPVEPAAEEAPVVPVIIPNDIVDDVVVEAASAEVLVEAAPEAAPTETLDEAAAEAEAQAEPVAEIADEAPVIELEDVFADGYVSAEILDDDYDEAAPAETLVDASEAATAGLDAAAAVGSEALTGEAAQTAAPAFEQAPDMAAAPAFEQAPAQEQAPAAAAPEKTKTAKPKKKILIPIIIAAAVVVIAAIAIPVVINATKQSSYDTAEELMAQGDYEGALAKYEELGSFNDAEEKAALARKAIDYEKGMEQFNNGNYEEAITFFESAGDYEAADIYVTRCDKHIKLSQAIDLMSQEKYEEAREVLGDIFYMEDVNLSPYITECNDNMHYNEAVAALEAGNNYEAYENFMYLGEFKDAADMAAKCIVATPPTGETYRNGDYVGSDCTLTIVPPSGDGSQTYMKIYTADGALVSCIFMNSGEQAAVDLPAGSYIFKTAYGYGLWFGEKDMFGDDGIYQVMLSDGVNEIFSLDGGYIYTLTLRNSGGSNNNVGSENENRNDF